MVAVVTPDGLKELWAVASSHAEAVAVVKKMVPEGSKAELTSRRLPTGPRTEGIPFGQARRVEPWP